ncbi:MAG: bifunctional glutamate N-acetyltransferase/amino-acid acetyltransferase ArgJ [Pseudomonadota bacterium]|nr:bifunctional glutamate N-acetyltransferase/amino-acid acetyltransferase ArgJ [Pseudomonadota bacterium]
MPFSLSPLAPKKLVRFRKLEGVSVSSVHCGLKKNKKDDLVLIKFTNPSLIYGVFTKSKTPGEPIIWNRSIIKKAKVSAILINSGNANVFNGRKGKESVDRILKKLSKEMNINSNQIYLASTGVIGEPLDDSKIVSKIPYLINKLDNKSESWIKAANAIRTTDTYAKYHSEKISIKKNQQLFINGLAKGSGMIAPNMATMLSFIITNANLSSKNCLKKFKECVDKTFNSITVDSDMSTSDMVLLISLNNEKEKLNEKNSNLFFNKLEDLMTVLSHYIVKDGEGAKKFITIKVTGTDLKKEAKKIAFSIANSPLFKTAMAGSDSNWGRIIMAIGKSNVKINLKNISIKFGKNLIVKNGEIFKDLKQSKINNYLKKTNIELDVKVGLKNNSSTIWTCDLTKDYISINTNYRS